jgi:outer membrane protein assembly factor BamB
MSRGTLATAALVLLLGLIAPARPGLPTARPATRPVAASVPAGSSWTTYHHDNGHTGYDAAAPALGTITTTPGWTETALDGQVYAEPLVYGGVVYATTLNNTVYALRQTDGTELWHKNLGAPVTGGWQCGNVSPQGILGTGVLDTAANRIYVATILNSNKNYYLFGLDLNNSGNVVLQTDITTAVPGFDWTIEQERGALSLNNGYVYVPLGGRWGDCGSYHGYVVGVPTSGSTSLPYYQTPSSGSGIWAAGGLVVDDAVTNNVFAATGNAVSSGCGSVDQNDAVVRLGPTTLAMQDYFMPQDWQNDWCANDQDLGSAGPLLLSPNLMFQAGKWGGGFLLDPNALGGVDGQLFPTPRPASYSQAEVCFGNHSDATFGSFAYAAPYVYLECEGRGIVALHVDTTAKTFVPCDSTCPAPDWHALSGTTFGPPIVAGGAVWAASDGNGLYAFNATTGAVLFHSAGFGINRFVTPAEANGQVFVPSHTVIKSFSFGVPLNPNDNQGHLYTLDGYGGIHADGVAPAYSATGYWPGWNIARSIALFRDSSGGYTLDGWGGIHQFGSAPPVSGASYWAGWDIARQVVLAPWATAANPQGWTLDGYGGVHPFGGAPAISASYFGFDIARGLVILPDSTPSSVAGYTLDGYGGLHPFGGAPAPRGAPYWGWDIARGITFSPSATRSSAAGWVLDGYGGLHPFNGATAYSNFSYWGFDIGRGVVSWTGGSGGWTLDGYGGVHPYGSAPAIPYYPYWPGFDIATGLAGANFGTGSRQGT